MSGDAGQTPEIQIPERLTEPGRNFEWNSGLNKLEEVTAGEKRLSVPGWMAKHWKSLSITTACLLSAGVVLWEASLNKAPNPFLAAAAPIGTKSSLPTEMTPTGTLIQTVTPTEQPATATPTKAASPAAVPNEATPTKAPSTSQKEVARVSPKEITPANFSDYFAPVKDKNELIQLSKEQGKFPFLELENSNVFLKKDSMIFSGGVTLRAWQDVARIMSEKEYIKLMTDYSLGKINTEKPVHYIVYVVPGEGQFAPVTQLEFIIGELSSQGRLELTVDAPLEALGAITYGEKIGDSVKAGDELIKIKEYGGGKGTVGNFRPNEISFAGRFKQKGEENQPGKVTFIDNTDIYKFAQKGDKAAILIAP